MLCSLLYQAFNVTEALAFAVLKRSLAYRRAVKKVIMPAQGPQQNERLSSWNQRTEVHDWKRRSERLVRASGHIYTIVRPGWFDYNNDDEHRIVMLQGDRRHAGTPEDGVISREQIAQVLVTALSNDAAKNKTFELVAERGEAQQDLTPLFAELRNDNPQKNDGVFDIDNMPLTEEPECVINDLNLYSKNSKI